MNRIFDKDKSDPKTREIKCDKHGVYTSTNVNYGGLIGNSVWSKCTDCHREYAEEKMRLQKLQLVESKQKAINDRLGKCGVKTKFQSCTFDSLVVQSGKHQHIINQCRKYAERFPIAREMGSGLILYGEPGTGKNHIASAIAAAVITLPGRNYTAALHKGKYICSDVRNAWQQKRKDIDVIKDYASPDLLIIDEIKASFMNETNQDIIFDVIDDRASDNKPTIIISNCDINGEESIKEILGEPTIDRMREGSGKPFCFDWGSYRSKKKNTKLWVD